MPKQKVNIVTLGCSKNLVDSERIAAQLQASHLETEFDSTKQADIVIINTCGFVQDAKQESIDTILSFAQAKKKGKVKKLIVAGCLSERYKDELLNSIPEVDGFFGTYDMQELIKSLDVDYKAELLGDRKLSTPSHYAYLKIADGCDRQCAFCAIPQIKGKHHSKPIPALVDEARKLADKGVKELILISQDLSYYGIDVAKKRELYQLVESLLKIESFDWVRLHYLYPSGFPLEILSLMTDNERVCNYIDIPFQHISDDILHAMRRGHTGRDIYELIDKFRESLPDVAIRSTLIVGFPGETHKHFAELKKFVETTRFERLGVFTYSHEENTPAQALKDRISAQEKQERLEEIMQLQQNISYEKNYDKVGKVMKVLIDRKEGQFFIGRSQFDSPEVDNEILIPAKEVSLEIGNFYQAKITSAEAFDLFAEIIQ